MNFIFGIGIILMGLILVVLGVKFHEQKKYSERLYMGAIIFGLGISIYGLYFILTSLGLKLT